jgi:predicted ATPase
MMTQFRRSLYGRLKVTGTGAEQDRRAKSPIREARVRNFLSLKDVKVRLDRLNVLVGPNGGGKSNFLSVFRFLGEVARTDLAPALQTLFGGYEQVRFRGETKPGELITIDLTGEVTDHSSQRALDEYQLAFGQLARGTPKVLHRHETLILKRTKGRGRRITLEGNKIEWVDVDRQPAKKVAEPAPERTPVRSTVEPSASALSVLRRIGEASDTKQVGQLAAVFEALRLFDPQVELARLPAPFEANPRLTPNARNLASVLAHWREDSPEILAAIEDDMRNILPGFEKFAFHRLGGADEGIRIDIMERGLTGPTPMARASFGTVRAIALLTMLRDPDPPRLTCLEEIDHGLHPHALDIVVERLREAADRSQIILATHSPALVNRLDPTELIIFERDPQDCSTRVSQKDPAVLKKMTEDSGLSLGELWFSGTLGGVPG